MKSITAILGQKMNHSAFGKSIYSALVLAKAEKVLLEFFGSQIGQYIKLTYFKDNILAVHCSGSAVAQELKINEKMLMSKINQTLPGEKILKIKFLL